MSKVFEELGKWFLNLSLVLLATLVLRPFVEDKDYVPVVGIPSAISSVAVGSLFLFFSTKLRRLDNDS